MEGIEDETQSLFWWGMYLRGLGFVYAVSFASLYAQIPGLDKIYPTKMLLDRITKDEPSRLLRFPTFSWLSATTFFMQVQCMVGFLAAVAVIIGVFSNFFMFLSWAIFLSLATVMSEWLCFPWDCLQLEMGFLALFLPPLDFVSNSVALSSAPVPFLSLIMKVLLFRVIFGMGKKKFGGPFWNHMCYLKWFMAWEPLPTPLAWYVYHLPMWVHKFNLVGLFLVEVFPFPFFLLIPHSEMYKYSLYLIILLQVGIGLCGNYGVFNLLTAILCISNFQTITLQIFPNEVSLTKYLITCILIVYFLASILYLPWCSYSTLIWLHIPNVKDQFPYKYVPSVVMQFLKKLAPFRVVHAFGVFGYKSPKRKGTRTTLIIEASEDGLTWKEIKPKYFPTNPEQAPTFFAPYQPRIDHQLWYEGQQQRACLFNFNNPYYQQAPCLWFPRLLQLLLQSDPDVLQLFGENPFQETPPKYIRALKATCFYTQPGDTEGKWFYFTSQDIHTPSTTAMPPEHWLKLKPLYKF